MSVLIQDPFHAAEDPQMPFLWDAIDPLKALPQLEACCTELLGSKGGAILKSIRVARYKPSRRCLVEYELRVGGTAEPLLVLGKARAKSLNKKAPELLKEFRNAGFNEEAADGICVPEPLGVIPEFRMWLQRKIRGISLTELLTGPDGAKWAICAANAAHKIHQTKILTDRVHTMSDELRILQERLGEVARAKPELEMRIRRLLSYCDRLSGSVPPSHPCGIHRDYYPAQIVAEAGEDAHPRPGVSRIYVTDFDLYCSGDPGLDIGNFLGHLTEQSLRQFGNPTALSQHERALKEQFLSLVGERFNKSVEAYHTLTLARHIYLSTQFPDRQHLTGPLLELGEQRLGVRGSR